MNLVVFALPDNAETVLSVENYNNPSILSGQLFKSLALLYANTGSRAVAVSFYTYQRSHFSYTCP